MEAGARVHAFDEARSFRLLVESFSEHAIYMIAPDGRAVSGNPAAERIDGYPATELPGLPTAEFFPPDERESGVPHAMLQRARDEGHAAHEGWRVRQDGSRYWSFSNIHAIRDDGGELIGFANIVRDMTRDRAAQQALMESERRFRYLVEGVVDYAIFMLDVNGSVTNWNRGAERIKGYRAEEIVGRHFSCFYTVQDRRTGLPARALATALSEGRFAAEGWRIRKDGTRFWASVVIDTIHDDEGRHIGYAKITRDMTEQRAAQDALEQSERQFRLLVAGVTDYALFMLDPNGIITNWNPGAEKIKGYRADEIVGHHVSVFYTPADRAAALPMKAMQTAATEGRYEAEAWRVRKDGTLFFANVVLDAIRDEKGELVGFAKITRDITERRNAQLELQKANERILQAQKLEAVGQLTGGVAHDFNNLLMVVTGQAHLLRKEVADNPRALRAIEAILAAGRRGQDLTRHLLAFARRQRLNPMPILLNERIETFRELLATSLGSIVTLSIDLPEGLWPVEVDPGEFELALLNMAVNARDAMPSGGMLTVSGRNRVLKGSEGAPDLTGDFVALSISDTGTGIPPDVLPKVFEPFFTTKDVSKGTGLGLSQVHGFVQQSGGRTTIESTLGRGTVITLHLPRSHRIAPAAKEQMVEASEEAAAILVVEDNPEVGEVTAGLLEQLGHAARVVSSAAAALDALAQGPLPDLVLSDIVMAGEMNGLALAREIRAAYPALPIILATGYSQATITIGDEFPFLGKPYQLHELSAAINLAMHPGTAAAGSGKLVKLDAARLSRHGRRNGGH